MGNGTIMNILHFLEKLPGHFLTVGEEYVWGYTVLLYLIDTVCLFRISKKRGAPLWRCFLPFYQWKVLFEDCWNLKAFREHFFIEVSGFAIPVIIETTGMSGPLEKVFLVLDLLLAIWGIKHAFEISELSLESYEYPKKYAFLIFLFDIPLWILAFGKNAYHKNASKE